MAAFTTVSTRRGLSVPSLAGPSAFPPAPPPQQPKKPTVFPPAVREYVQRCFASDNAIPGITGEEMQARLKAIINEAAERGALGTVDWASQPLPQQLIHDERKAAAKNATRPKPQDNMSEIRHEGGSATITNKINPKKRKSSEMAEEPEAVTDSAHPPWRKVHNRNAFEDRVTPPDPTPTKRADRRQRKGLDVNPSESASKSFSDLERRRQRFDLGRFGNDSPGVASSRDESPAAEAANGPVIGTSQSLEKKYFRLTSAPKPETVRPLDVLEKAVALLQQKWIEDKNYPYICDQLKAVRQDLTVQHIKDPFTVRVYEMHARIALEKWDLGEYNQCQTQLRALYKQNLGGNPAEFLAYRIIYFLYTCNRTDMNNVLADLTEADRQDPAVKHALDARSALALGNYHRFFKLYSRPPNMGIYLMDMFIVRERLAALANICKAYKPDVKLDFIKEELGFEDEMNAAAFICDHGGQDLLETKGSVIMFACGKAGSIFESAKAAAFRRVDIKGQI